MWYVSPPCLTCCWLTEKILSADWVNATQIDLWTCITIGLGHTRVQVDIDTLIVALQKDMSKSFYDFMIGYRYTIYATFKPAVFVILSPNHFAGF